MRIDCRALVATYAVVILAAACTGASHPNPTPSRPLFARGGTLLVGEPSYGGYSDPQVDISGFALELERCCLARTLLSYNGLSSSEGGGVLRPDLATALPVISPDGLTWTFRIKRGLHYAPPLQSTEIVAGDFIRSLEREVTLKRSYGLGIGGYYTDDIQGAQTYADEKAPSISGLEAPDDHTLVIHTTKPVGDLGYKLAIPVTAPIPPSPWDPGARYGAAQGHDGEYGSFLVASGPYMFEGSRGLDLTKPPREQKSVEGVTDSSLTLVRNPSWNPAADPLRPAYADRIVITPLPDDPEAAAQRVLAGGIDVIFDAADWYPSPREFTRPFEGTADLRKRIFENTLGVVTMSMNMGIPPFDDLHVRRAVQFAIDKTALASLWERNDKLGAPASHSQLDSTEDDLLLNYQPYGRPTGSLARAKQEMTLSPYDRNHDGICDARVCRSVAALVRNDPRFFLTLAQNVRSNLAPVGIELRIESSDEDTIWGRVSDPRARVPMSIGDGWGSFYPNAANGVPDLSPAGLTAGCCNIILAGATREQLRRWGYTVTSVPNPYARVEQCLPLSFDAATRCWAALDQYVTEEVAAFVPLLTRETATVVSTRVENVSFDQSTNLPALDQIALAGASVATPGSSASG
jgi:ABC-type transport system substrate-binding protein